MHFSTLFAGALAGASVASALPLARRTGEHGKPPAGVTPGQWEDIWTKCGDQVQHGLINIGIDACVVAEVEALIGTVIDLTHLPLAKRTGEHGDPPAGVTPGQWQDIWVKCESQEQHGLINVGVDACVVAAVEALVGTLIHLPLEKRTGEHGDPPAGVTPGQWQDIWVKCESQEQHGLINVGVDACVVAAVEAIVGTLVHIPLEKRTGEHGDPPAGVTPGQWENIWTDCGKQEQEGLINIGIDACVVAAVEALVGTVIDLTHLPLAKRTGEPPAGVTPGQWEKIWADCGKQEQEGLINVGIDACVVAAVEAIVGTVVHLPLDKRTGEPPAGVTPGQWEKIWADCGKQEQEGLINVGIDLCVAAAVEALLATIVHA